MLPFPFDFKNPDYDSVYEWRLERLARIRENPECIPLLKEWYAEHPADFISHWGYTFDPRNAERGLPTRVPFLLFDRQAEWVDWTVGNWKAQQYGITEKTRDMGMSWLSVATACTLCLFNERISIGFGSRKEEYVDKLGDPKSLFFKARMFMETLPLEFRGGWVKARHAPHMRIMFPESESVITGESGDGIGRGDRQAIYFVDEAAYLERPQLVEASLSATTNCRQDISTSHGMANPFAQKRHSGKFPVFTFHWRDDPRKDDAWYEKQVNNLDPVTLAQEIDINYQASVEGIVIPGAWVQASINAAARLGIELTGNKIGALDVADEGIDLNAFAVRKGVEVQFIKAWSGKGSDTLYTSEEAFLLCDMHECDGFLYDADGIGTSVRGDSRMINERRATNGEKEMDVVAFRGSGEVGQPERQMVPGRKNKDFFKNFKAQSWWSLRLRFQTTFRAIDDLSKGLKLEYDKDEIISLSSDLPDLQKLVMELSQPTYTIDTTGKILIDKAPDGTRSPNLADSVMMVYSPPKKSVGFFS